MTQLDNPWSKMSHRKFKKAFKLRRMYDLSVSKERNQSPKLPIKKLVFHGLKVGFRGYDYLCFLQST